MAGTSLGHESPWLTLRVMSRRQRTSNAPAVHPTYTKILAHAVAVLNEDGFDRFNVQRVLDAAEVSRPTLYRHFGDVDGLIEAALVQTFGQEVDRHHKLAMELLGRSPDRAQFREGIRALLFSIGAVPARTRLRRAHAVALGDTRPELAAGVARVQEELTNGWEMVLREAQRLGHVRADLDTRAVAVMVQGITLGRIVDDAAVTHVTNEQWAEVCFDIVDRTFLTPAR